MSKPGLVIILLLLGLNSSPELVAGSTIYKHVDQDGNITFTNRPIKGGGKRQTSRQPPQSRKATLYTPKRSPDETVQIQNKREIKRREILEHELAAEMMLFSGAQRNLSLLKNDIERHRQEEKIRQLRTKIQRHESNITALKKELTKL
ncbi:protein of unknown function [Nitrosomonas sp. Nm51]|uniref:DUF4124 domain-containing protein n=1 Tax=Nitrosomonas sp. Nm51 TaxID=133720 RepID=UPI0008AB329B|nr:DUF4124 domain-containing protein [Nitrosomonas sp. Nm51]SER55449.1 protein of unknown function [Nitrosomonas sp. Nm51]